MPDSGLLAAASDPARFAAALASLPGEVRDEHPRYGAFGRRYYPVVFGSRLEDHSFAVEAAGGRGWVIVECDVLDGVLGRFGMPLKIETSDAPTGVQRSLVRQAVQRLSQIAGETSAQTILIADPGSRGVLGELGLACLAAGGPMQVRMHAVADLALSEEQLRADVRKSMKPQINWGRRSLELRYCNAANSERAICDDYQRLHVQVAGRVTASQSSWDVMFDTVCGGGGELVTAYLEEELVGGLVVIDGSRFSYYTSAAFVRERFDLPLAHWPLMDAILRSKQRGMRWFEIGELAFAGGASRKEETISHFKKAFTSRVEMRPEWRLLTAPDSGRSA